MTAGGSEDARVEDVDFTAAVDAVLVRTLGSLGRGRACRGEGEEADGEERLEGDHCVWGCFCQALVFLGGREMVWLVVEEGTWSR